METVPPEPVPWEMKASMAALALIAVQAVREIFLFVLGTEGMAYLGPLSLLLLIAALRVGTGLHVGSRGAWRFGVLFFGTVASLHLAVYGPILRALLGPPQYRYVDSLDQYEWIKPDLDPEGAFWVASRGALLLAVPGLLLLGRLRQALKRPTR